MSAVEKDQLLNGLERSVNEHIQSAVVVFQNMRSDLLLKPAPDGGWSIAQCLEHLNRYGSYYIPQIRQGLARQKKLETGGVFKSGVIGAYFTRMMDLDRGQKKIKAFKEYIPGVELDAHAVVAEFIRQQEMLLACVRCARRVDLGRPRIPVSIMKWLKLKLGDVLQFVVMHDERHIRQAKRNCPMD
ncbi:MAG TPA: DinB family protein [Puia sp.]|nr:DinB family protein [Puia sp.]